MYADRPELETRTKIVATLGPASWDDDMVGTLIDTGVDVFRINCSHADHDGIRRQIASVRAAAQRKNRPTAVLLDLQGPKIRTGPLDEPLQLSMGDVLTVQMQEHAQGGGNRVGTTWTGMADDVGPGERVLFADGALAGEVVAVRHTPGPAEVDICITAGGALGSHKGINLPGVTLRVPCLTPKDLSDLAVGIEAGVDFVALSFVQRAADVRSLRTELARLGDTPLIIAKIEKPQAVHAIDEILEEADGVMVARGDLGVEVAIEKVPVYQKRIIAAAHRAGALCITATQMLDSMERNPRPTRAETTDVANAILDGTDAVMLSGETAIGSFPVQAVQIMDKIAREVESSRFFTPTPMDELPPYPGTTGIVARAACFAASEKARPLVIFTWSGSTARYASKARTRGPILALTPNPRTANQLALAWGVTPLLVPEVHSTDELIVAGETALIEAGHLRRGEEIVILAGQAPRRETTNVMKIHEAGIPDS